MPCIIFLDKLLPFCDGIKAAFVVDERAPVPRYCSIALDRVSIALSYFISILLLGYLYFGSGSFIGS